jgi:hypothetical protein
MGNFTGWTYAAVNAIAREVSNIEFRLYQVKGEKHEELEDHDLLTLLDTVNEHVLPYVGRLLAFAKKIKATDPASAALNLWVAQNYLRNINNFALTERNAA